MNVLSLFSGAGGLDIGFHNAGFNLVGCVEIEKLFCKTLEQNRATGKYISAGCQVFNQNIATFDVSQLSTKEIDFVIGGPPCQTYSASGRRIGGAPGLDDDRGKLFEHYCRILAQLNPQGFLFENVRGLLGVNNGEAWKAIIAAFSELGYDLFHCVLDAAAYGVPQHRERIFLVGVKANQKFLFPQPLFGPDSASKAPYITAGEALSDLQNDEEPYHEYNGKYGYLLSGIPEGLNYSYYTAEMGHSAPVFAWRSKFSSFLYKIAQDAPVKTIQAQLGKFAGPFHWKNRRLTVSELKRLQSFPDDYQFAGSYDQIAKQIGNSVPPILATYLAQTTIKQLFDMQAYPELELMNLNFRQSFDARKSRAASKTRTITQRVKSVNTTGQLSLWDNNLPPLHAVPSLEEFDANNKFVYCYASPVKRTILDFEEAIPILDMNDPSKITLKASKFFAVEVFQSIQSSNKLEIKIRDLDFTTRNYPCWQLNLKLDTPLSGAIDELEAIIFCNDPQYFYVAWDALEEAIKGRSAYISLVALHGHFAEPHRKFSLSLKDLTDTKSDLAKLIEFYSRFENCSRNIPSKVIAQNIGVEQALLPQLIRQLRDIRYDVRSAATTKRIPENHYFCAYPFPELTASYQINKPV